MSRDFLGFLFRTIMLPSSHKAEHTNESSDAAYKDKGDRAGASGFWANGREYFQRISIEMPVSSGSRLPPIFRRVV